MFDSLSDKLTSALRVLQGDHKISESNVDEALQNVRSALLEADVHFQVVRDFTQRVKEKAMGTHVLKGVKPGEQFVKIIHDELVDLMGNTTAEMDWSRPGTRIVLVAGLNGAGKTTFCGKLALHLRQKKKKDVLLVPADTFRPAAKDQLQILAKNMGIDCYDSDLSLSPREISLKAYQWAQQNQKQVVIIDTAGRLHVDEELMSELKDLKTSLDFSHPEILLVLDAMSGQEALSVATSFKDAIQPTGAVLSKMDSDTRGGAAISLRYVTNIPIRFISTGEKMRDLELFHPDRLAQRILDMGDVLTLVEKAEEVVSEEEAMGMMEKLQSNRFSMEDFLKQMEAISKMGPITSLMKMIPGMGGMMKNMAALQSAEGEMRRVKIMMSSMTKEEKKDEQLFLDPKKGGPSRIKRVAKGSGTTVKDVEEFLKKFVQMKKMIPQMMNSMGGLGMLGGLGGGLPKNLQGGGNAPASSNSPQNKSRASQGKGKGKGQGPFGRRYF